MNLEKINFENIEDLLYIMRRPWKILSFTSVKEMIEIMKNTDKKITVHLYPVGSYRGKEKSLLNMYEWSYHQIYLAIKDNKIFCCMGHGDSSGSREYHNHLIDLFLENKELQKQVPTAVLVVYKNILLAYYFHGTYSYSNHDIGSNWDRKIRKKLELSKIPYSYHTGSFGNDYEIRYKNKNKDMLIYKSVKEDILMRKIKIG